MFEGGPAFPQIRSEGDQRGGYKTVNVASGMSLRDWFAGHALAGQLACSVSSGTDNEYAQFAYLLADAMLKAREAQHD